MNKIYKIIWSKVKNCYVVVSELAKNHTKSPKNGVVNQRLENHVMLSLCNSAVCVPVFSTGFVAPIATNIATEAKKEWSKPFKITVAAIVKNEAKNVPQWVQAARSCADEIVVVDTGSTDGTVERFADYGIKCFHYDWNDDFAAAKNYMISLCHGDWIVLLDGDEWFREGCDVRKAIAKHHGNPVTKAIIADWICLDTSRDNVIMFSGGAVRAFRNQPDIRYFRKVHENLTIKYENFVFEPDFKMYHTGYSGNVNRSKHERNLRIMRTMFDFDNGKVEFPTDWRYIQDTYAGLGDFEKSLWASDQMLSFGVPEYSATSWLTRFNVLFAMRTSMERMDKEFEYCFKTVPSVSGFRFLASIYYFRNGRVEKALDNYIEGIRMLMEPQDKVAMEHTYWRMYLPEASALASAVYLQSKQAEAALYACKVSEQYCGKNYWTDMALDDVLRLMNLKHISLNITDKFLPVFNFSKKAVLATALVSSLSFGFIGISNQVYAASCNLNGVTSNCASGTDATVTGGSSNLATGDYSSVAGGVCNYASGDSSSISGGSFNVASGESSSVTGGSENIASGNESSITGGAHNQAIGVGSSIGGGSCNITNGYTSSVTGGWSNTASGNFSSVTGGYCNTASGCLSSVIGGDRNIAGESYSYIDGSGHTIYVSPTCSAISQDKNTITIGSCTYDLITYSGTNASISGGILNIASGINSSISGGSWNIAIGDGSSVIGGFCNIATGEDSSISGGAHNQAIGGGSSISGGSCNKASGSDSSVSGGNLNIASERYSSVTGGSCNTASGDSSSITGGQCNIASGSQSSISGGFCNSATGSQASVSGGYGNISSGFNSSISGGDDNEASGNGSSVSGGSCNIASGSDSSVSGGRANIASDFYSSVSGGSHNTATGLYSFVSGGSANTASGCSSSIVGGSNNIACGCWSSIIGGCCNTASGCWASISGGYLNIASDCNSSVSGGDYNIASGPFSSITGGRANTASGEASSITAGVFNTASGCLSSVSGGRENTAGKYYSYIDDYGYVIYVSPSCSDINADKNTITVGNSTYDLIAYSGQHASVTGGRSNIASGCDSSISGGTGNIVIGDASSISGGLYNTANGTNSSVTGGIHNIAEGDSSSVTGGFCNIASESNSSVTGGWGNIASGCSSFVGGGRCNVASSCFASVSGGNFNTANGLASSIAGGGSNKASGDESSVSGGRLNTAGGSNSWIAGGCCGYAYADYSSVIGGGITGNAECATTALGSVAIGKGANTTQDYEVTIGSACAPVTLGGDLTVTDSNTISDGTTTKTWSDVLTSGGCNSVFIGATSSVPGTVGLVKAPAVGDESKFLRGDGTWAVDNDTTYSLATPSTAGLMSASDKSKLDTIDSDFNVYILPTATSSTLGGVKIGSNITVSDGIISLTKDNVTNALGYVPPTIDTDTTYTPMTASELTTGTDTTARSITAKVLSDYVGSKVLDVKNDSITDLSVNGNTITYTKGNGTTGTITTQDTDTHYTTHLYAGTGTASNSTTTNGNTKLALADGSIVRNTVTIKGTGGTTVTSDNNGVITIDSVISNNSPACFANGVVLSGCNNTASGCYSSVSGGICNTVTGNYGSISGGYANLASGSCSSVTGGSFNVASGINSSVTGGIYNIACGLQSSISGGCCNIASGCWSSITGGYNNNVFGEYSSVTGGSDNIASGRGSSVSGGFANKASRLSSVSGGGFNVASGDRSSVSGGSDNIASNAFSSVSGGCHNTAQGEFSWVAGGFCGTASACYSSSIGGGIATTLASVAIGTGARTIQNFEVAIGSVCAPVNIGGNLTVTGTNTVTDGTNTKTWSELLTNNSGNSSGSGGTDTNSVTHLYAGDGNALNAITTNGNTKLTVADDTMVRDSIIIKGTGGTTVTSDENGVITIDSVISNNSSACFASGVVLGGCYNIASGCYSSVIGGSCNTASGDNSSVSGGWCNTASGRYSSSIGGNRGYAYANYSTSIGGGIAGSADSSIIAVGSVAIGKNATTTRDYEVVIGSFDAPVRIDGALTVNGAKTVTDGTTTRSWTELLTGNIAGFCNIASGNWSSISGGYLNTASGCYSSVNGGQSNSASGCFSSVTGGLLNRASGHGSSVSGGECNTASSYASSVSGGYKNEASGNRSSVSGGWCNVASGCFSSVSGGYWNIASGCHSSVGSGSNNTASGVSSSVSGGHLNVAGISYSYVDSYNRINYVLPTCSAISADKKTIVVGDCIYNLTAYNGNYSSVSGGYGNMAIGTYSSVSGGNCNTASGYYSSVNGGNCNIASGDNASVSGGYWNIASGCYSSVGSGVYNKSSGKFSWVAGGCCGIADADYSTSIGGGITRYASEGSVAIGKCAITTKDYEVTIGSACAPVTIGGDLTVNSQIHGVVAGTEDTDAVNFGQLKSYLGNTGDSNGSVLAYDTENHDNITFSGTNGTKLSNVKSGLINQTSMDAVNGAQLYAVKQDISGFARDIKSNENQIRSLSSSINSMNTFNSSFITLIDTVDLSKANTSLNNLDSSGRQVITDIVFDYLSQQNNINSPNAPLLQNNALTITDAGNGSLHVGEGSYVNGTSSIAIGVGNQVNANNSGAFGDPSVINADESYVLGNDDTINTGATGSFIVGNDGVSDAKGGLLFGSNTKATVSAEDGMGLGNRTEVSVKNAIALGSGSIADTENTLSIGNANLKRKIVNVADGDISQNSNEAVTGAQLFLTNEKVQKNTEAIGKKADVDAGNINTSDWASKLGIGKIEADNTDLVTGGTVYDAIRGINTNNGLVQANGDAITVGANSTETVINVANANGQGRVITGVITDVDDATSAANVGYVNQISENIARSTNAAFQKMDNRINKAGANAAAIASLPTPTFDGDEKWAFSAGVGHYHGETAASAGAFYKPQDNVIVRVGGSFGNGDEMVGAGVSVSLNKGNTPAVSKVQLVRTINAQAGQIQQQANEIQNMKIVHQSQMDDMKAIQQADMQRIAELEAQLVRVTAKLDELAK